MSIPIDIHIEAQYAASNRAKCTICGLTVLKGQPIIKLLGFRINKTVHPACLQDMVRYLSHPTVLQFHANVIRSSGDGLIKVGLYEKVDGSHRWKTITKVKVKGE